MERTIISAECERACKGGDAPAFAQGRQHAGSCETGQGQPLKPREGGAVPSALPPQSSQSGQWVQRSQSF